MRKLILLMNPPGIQIKKIVYRLLMNIQTSVSFVSLTPISTKQNIFSLDNYFSELAVFSERITNIINDSKENEIIIISGFFTTLEEREYIYNAIKRANHKIKEQYGVWIEDTMYNLQNNNCKTVKDLFDYLYTSKVSPTEDEIFTDIYYIIKYLNIGTSKKHHKIYDIKTLLKLLGKDCDYGQDN